MEAKTKASRETVKENNSNVYYRDWTIKVNYLIHEQDACLNYNLNLKKI